LGTLTRKCDESNPLATQHARPFTGGFVALPCRSQDRGRERVADGHTASGAQYLQRASAYYRVGERFLQPKSKDGLDA